MRRILFSLIFFSGCCFAQETDSLDLIRKSDSIKLPVKKERISDIDDVVITGTIKPVSKSKSPVNVEIYSQKFFQKNLYYNDLIIVFK